ncbi:MAG: hypothetical protein ACR2PI_24105 [Hyphomicrobiaceae bacterium]
MKLCAALIALAVSSVTAFAGEVANVSGVGKGKATSMVEAVGKGHLLMQSVTEYASYKSADPKSPFNGMTGKCWGAIEIKPPTASGKGNCAFATTSGDKHFNTWTATGLAKDGALVGTWAIVGGSGKFAGASGGGKFHSLTDRDAGTFVNTVSGAVVLK